MKYIVVNSRRNKWKKSRPYRRHRRVHQKPKPFQDALHQMESLASSDFNSIPENISSKQASLSFETQKGLSTNITVIDSSSSNILSNNTDTNSNEFQNKSWMPSNFDAANNNVEKMSIRSNKLHHNTQNHPRLSSCIHLKKRILLPTASDSMINSNHKSHYKISRYNPTIYSMDYKDEKNQEKRRRQHRRICGIFYCSPCCCLLTGLLLVIGLLVLITLIGILIIIQTNGASSKTITTTSSTSTTTTSVTTTTATTTTSSTSSSSSTSSTSTSSTSSSSTSSSSTSSSSTSSSTASTTSSTSVSTTTVTTISTTTIITTTTAATVAITSNTCTSSWRGATILYHCYNCSDIIPYAHYIYTYTAIANRTRIAFAFREDVGCFTVDTISVRRVSTPNPELIANNDFETGDLTSWTYCNPNSASHAGQVMDNSLSQMCVSTTLTAHLGTKFYYDGAVGNCDYLFQTFATTIGETYTISYWLFNEAGGGDSSADVIISI